MADEGNRQSLEEILERQADVDAPADGAKSNGARTRAPKPDGAERREREAETGDAEAEAGDRDRERARPRDQRKATAALATGIAGIVAGLLIPILGLVLGAVAVFLAFRLDRSGQGGGRARAGLFAGGAAVLVSIAMFFVWMGASDTGDEDQSRQERREERRDERKQERREQREDN
jgi:hypothetical protein